MGQMDTQSHMYLIQPTSSVIVLTSWNSPHAGSETIGHGTSSGTHFIRGQQPFAPPVDP